VVEHTGTPRPAPLSLRLELAALALFVALSVAHTWPLAAAPGTYCRNDNWDTVLNEWTLAWVADALPSRPLRLFDANIFYPERRTLAYSEHMLPQSLMAAPVRYLGGSPVLAYNLALLAGFALTGWAFSHLVFTWTGSWWAGVIAGSLAAFNSHSFTRLGHLQAQHVEFLPLALLALDRVLRVPRLRSAVSLAWWSALQALTSGYFLTFTALSLAAAALVRPAEWLRRGRWRTAAALAGAAALAALLVVPFVVPYIRVKAELGLSRPMTDAAIFAASLTDYLATSATPHWTWSGRFWAGTALFPGVIGIALALTALGTGAAFRDRRARMCLAIAVITGCLSFGTRFPLYPLLYNVFPFLQAIRAVSRFGQYTLMALAVLGGFGAAWWLGRLRRAWMRVALALLLLAIVQIESWHVPIRYARFPGLPRIHRTLAGQDGVTAYFPFYGRGNHPRNAGYMLASTLNWMPMLNGFSGFAPASFQRHVQHLSGFPDEAAIAYLRQAGVRFVVVDINGYNAAQAETMEQSPALRPWAREDNIRIYEVR
jgi:hypothetical protein